MINVKRAAESIAGLSLLKFFPSDENARAALLRIVCDMATTNAQVDWLVKRVLAVWTQWEGPAELRAVFCSGHRPADGIDCFSQLPQFADGIPSERDSPLSIETRSFPQLLPGETGPRGETDDPEFPRDALALMEEFRVRRDTLRLAPGVTEAEIESIKAEQDRNRKESAAGVAE
jgi:hypothetical protein